jgi:hypothetical protein
MMADPLACRMDDCLREVPADPAAFAAAVERLTDAVERARSQPRDLLARLGEAAPALRIAGRLDEARHAASAAVALAGLLEDPRAAYENQLRLAAVLHWQGQYALSTPLFDLLVSQARAVAGLGDLLDEALHRAALNLLDEGRPGQAAHFLREALALREAKGDAAPIKATRRALAVAAPGDHSPVADRRA